MDAPPAPHALLLYLVAALLAPLAVFGGYNDIDAEVDDFNVYHGYELLQTENLTASQSSALLAAGATWDFWEAPRGGARAVVFAGPGEIPAVKGTLRALGVRVQERRWTAPRRHSDPPLERHRRSLRAVSFTRFYRLLNIHEYLDDLSKLFPELVTVFSIGKSMEGRDLKVIRISSDGGRRAKPAVFIDAAIHAREWITPPAALYTVFQLVENYTANCALLDRMDWYVLPVVNPDGYEYTFTHERFWRKTRSFNGRGRCLGVDANRNFGHHWREAGASGNPCALTFGGLRAFSEPEALAVARFARSLAPRLRLYLSLHSYGPMLMFPWGHKTELPSDAEELNAVAEAAVAALRTVRGTKYTVGSAANVLYASSGTSRDWIKDNVGVKYVYTMELPPGGSGFDPPPEDILPVAVETFEAIKVLGKVAADTF